MNKVFASIIGKCVVIYMDDILVYSRTLEDPLLHLKTVLSMLRQHQSYAKLSKCEFLQSELVFLGHIVGADGLKPNPAKIVAVQEWPTPTSVKDLCAFVGLATFFRRFVQGFSSLVAPLTSLLKNKAAFVCNAKCELAFNTVKESLTSAPVLAMPDVDKPFEVWCDAFGIGIGALLLQNGHCCAFESRKLKEPELNYHLGEIKLLALVHAVKTWRCYRDKAAFVWNAKCELAFNTVKESLTSATVLAMPDVDKPFEVWCDAFGIGIGALLLQNGYCCAFESRKLKEPELNYHPGEIKLLAVVHAVKTWRCYLEGDTDVTMVTDHNPLLWLPTQSNLSPKQVRWSAYLQRFPFVWKYILGRTNVADPLSRSPALRVIMIRSRAREGNSEEPSD